MTDGLWLVVGLGNPGPAYAGNRHNVGQMVLDELAAPDRRDASRAHRRGARAATAEARLGTLPGGAPGPRVVLAKPTTYMNVSGGPVAGLAQYFGVDADHVVVVHDELDIPFAELRLKLGGGEGGHNGLRDISKALGTKDYLRVRVGVGRPPGRAWTPPTTCSRTSPGPSARSCPGCVDAAADAVEMLVTRGLPHAQLVLHTKT